MTLAEQVVVAAGIVGIIVGIVSAIVGIASWRANMVMAKANRGMEKSTRQSVALAKQSLTQSALAIQDQIETNRAARASSVDIISATYRHLDAGAPGPDDFPVFLPLGTVATIEVTVMNRGAAPAFGVLVVADDYDRGTGLGSRWRHDDPDSLYTDFPIKGWDVVHPAERKTAKFLVRDMRENDAGDNSELELVLNVSFTDTLDHHRRSFEITFFAITHPFPATGFILESLHSREYEVGRICPPS